MPKFIIRAHYGHDTVLIGTVDAFDKYDALTQAEQLGLMDDPDADDYTATKMSNDGQDLSKILGDAIKAHSK